jgi:PhzF family phenazine biosynthesis protein
VRLRFHQVDAFADRALAGNPAAVVQLDRWPDDTLLQAIAAENNLSETAFLVPAAALGADRDLRWFTPVTEIAMCGHATLASGHVLLADDPHADRIVFATRRAGRLTVGRASGGYTLDLPARVAAPAPLPGIVAALGLEAAPMATLWNPERYALAVLADAAAVRAAAPDFRALAAVAGDALVIVTAPGDARRDGGDIVSRAFVPGAGIDEDPVTGAAHAVLAPYWAERLGRADFTAVQASARGGRLGCRLDGDRVILTGRCATVIEGWMTV